MNFTEEFLNEFRKTIKEILLEGDLEHLNLAKEFLGFDNKAFGEFLAPLFKEEEPLTLHHSTPYQETDSNLTVVSAEDHKLLSEGKAPQEPMVGLPVVDIDEIEKIEPPKETSNYKWCPRIFSPSTNGDLCGIVLLTERGFEIEDVETGEVLYAHNFEVYKRFDLCHGLVISFSLAGSRIYDISYEKILEPKTGFTYV